jgi:hypothetical protein
MYRRSGAKRVRAVTPKLVPLIASVTLSLVAPAGAQIPSAADLKQLEDQVFVIVNRERANVGLPALSRAPELDAAARRHSQDMAANLHFSHTGTDGSTFGQRVTAAGYPGTPTGENISLKDPNGSDVLACPADGVAMNFAPVDTGTIGNVGGSLGIFGVDTFTAFEINTWQGQGLGNGDCTAGGNETFAFDVVNATVGDRSRREGVGGTASAGGAKIGQTPPPGGLKIVNGGWYRYQWNALADGTMEVYVTGLEAQNQRFRQVRILGVRFPSTRHLGFEGRFGLSAATGAAVQHTEVAAARVISPAVGPQ